MLHCQEYLGISMHISADSLRAGNGNIPRWRRYRAVADCLDASH
jgi:hypothetical protein